MKKLFTVAGSILVCLLIYSNHYSKANAQFTRRTLPTNTVMSPGAGTTVPTVNPDYYPVNYPNPYPSPDDPKFPYPGSYVEKIVGQTSDDIIDENTRYLRSSEFRQENMKSAIDQANDAMTKPNPEEYLPSIKQLALDTIRDILNKVSDKYNQIYNEVSLNDSIGTDILVKETATDDAIKADIMTFFTRVQTDLNSYKSKIENAQTVEELRGYAEEVQAFFNLPANQDEARSLGSRVMAQRILRFSGVLQTVVDWDYCMVTNMAGVGIDKSVVDLHYKYVLNDGSVARQSWEWETIVNPVLPYFEWIGMTDVTPYNNYFGARREYKLASAVLSSGTGIDGVNHNDGVGTDHSQPLQCDGKDDCRGTFVSKERAVYHMRKAKDMVQQMFHIGYWQYDNLLRAEQAGLVPKTALAQLVQICPIPQVPWMQMSGESPSKGPTPTKRPRINSYR